MIQQYQKSKNCSSQAALAFLGSHLIDRQLARGDEVICVDNFFTGS